MNKNNKVYANNIGNKSNNKKVFCSFENNEQSRKIDNNMEKSEKEKEELNKNINQKINDIFNSRNYIYKADVIIKMKNGDVLNERIIGKNNYNLITSDNKLIGISFIEDIQTK